MPGIYGMAAITIVVTAFLCVTFLNYLTGADRRYPWLLLACLPFSFLINQWVKVPIVTAHGAWAGIPLKLGAETPFWFIVLILFNAPVFEEAVKLLPFALPATRRLMKDASGSLWTGLALGMSFGLGEAAYIAYQLAQSSEFSALPWHMFFGYATERLIITFAHGFMTAIAAYGLYQGGRNALSGYLSVVGLHALMNLGPILLALKFMDASIASLESYAIVFIAFLVFQSYTRSARRTRGQEPKEVVYFER